MFDKNIQIRETALNTLGTILLIG